MRSLGDGRDAAPPSSARKSSTRRPRCVINVQATLQRHRADSAEMIATEVRLAALDELRRADRLAGVIHRSLHDAMRGAAEASGIVMPESAARLTPLRALAAAARGMPPREPGASRAKPPQPGSTCSMPVSRTTPTRPPSSARAPLPPRPRRFRATHGWAQLPAHAHAPRGSPGPPPNSGGSVLAPGSAPPPRAWAAPPPRSGSGRSPWPRAAATSASRSSPAGSNAFAWR